VDSIIDQVEGPLVVPADGIGRWARVWGGVGFFTDSVKTKTTHWRVRQEAAVETFKRVKEFEPQVPTLILMFCQIFIKDQEQFVCTLLKEKKIRLVYIDVIAPPVSWNARAVNDRIYEVGYPTLKAFSSLADMKIRKKGVKFSSTLLTIENPKFLSDSIFSEYYNLMNPFRSEESSPVYVFSSLEEEINHLHKSGKQQYTSTYSAYTGKFNSEVHLFLPGSRTYARQLYKCPLEWQGFFPSELIVHQRHSYFYFCYPEAATATLQFSGSGKKVSGHLDITFWSSVEEVPAMDTMGVLRKMFPEDKRVSYTQQEIESAFPDIEWEVLNPMLRSIPHVQNIKYNYFVDPQINYVKPALGEGDPPDKGSDDEDSRYHDSEEWVRENVF